MRDADPSPPSRAMVLKEQSYTSTPPMGRTACTEPQCLYKGALYLYLYLYLKQILEVCSLDLEITENTANVQKMDLLSRM